MKRTVLIFGTISGLLSSAMMFITMPLLNRGIINFDNGVFVGFTAIILSFLLVFFGVRSYRDSLGGSITFGRALMSGILIAFVSSLFYVASWQILYFRFMPDFVDRYAAHAVEKMKREGATEAEIARTSEEVREMKRVYDNPVTNAAYTFLEPFPVGLIVALVSAGILRRRSPDSSTAAAAIA